MESPHAAGQSRVVRLLVVSGILAMLTLFTLTHWLSADDGSAQPTPPTTPEVASPYAERVDTQTELEARPPSLERYVAGHAIVGDQLLDANPEESSKTASRDEAPAGGFVDYTIALRNTGDADASVTMTDTLPAQVDYVSHTITAIDNAFTLSFEASGGVVTWSGAIGPNGIVDIAVRVQVVDDVAVGTAVENTAEIVFDEQTLTRSAQFTVSEPTASPLVSLPFIIYDFSPDPPAVSLSATRPNSSNQWTVTLTPATQTGDGYQLQVAQRADFANAETLDLGNATTRVFNPLPSFNNVYFYRARSYDSGVFGEWSAPLRVVSGYRDDFDNPNSGWEVRRTTFIEEVQAFYEIRDGNDWFILRVEDSWDWGIASPLLPAPEPPYAIEFEAKHANIGNLVSYGGVFGGDKPGNICPDKSTVAGWYEHELCFNQFYNTNTIFFGGLKMLFERVDELVWCPNCGGSPMKRLGDIDPASAVTLSGVDATDWNRFRIEVRPGSIKVFAGERGRGLDLQYEYGDTRHIDQPYFGVFASTDEYSNSTARFEYFEVMPLDS